jgi:hypothetical protein
MSHLRARDLLGFKLNSKHLSRFEIVAFILVFMYFLIMSWLFFM